MSLLTEPMRCIPADLLLHEWTHLLLPCKPRGSGELWSTGEFQGASCSPASAEESCGRRLLHSIAFPLKKKNKCFRTSTVHHLGKKERSPEVRKRVTNYCLASQNNNISAGGSAQLQQRTGEPTEVSHCGRVPLHLSVLADMLLWISTQNKFTWFSTEYLWYIQRKKIRLLWARWVAF